MLSVGEVMAIGRNFEEAIQKATRMVSAGHKFGLDGEEFRSFSREEILQLIREPTNKR